MSEPACDAVPSSPLLLPLSAELSLLTAGLGKESFGEAVSEDVDGVDDGVVVGVVLGVVMGVEDVSAQPAVLTMTLARAKLETHFFKIAEKHMA